MLNIKILLAGFILLSFFTYSQSKDHLNHHHKSHYSSELQNEIKALNDEEMKQLLNGDGMGLAKAAELNGYPGPKHVLELSTELKLSEEQKEKTETLFNSVKGEAKNLGIIIVEKEKELDKLFRENQINGELLQNKISVLSDLKGRLRLSHLNAHLLQKEILTNEQIKTYNELRGYN